MVNLYFDDFVFVGSNKDLPATYKDPFSIAFGINYSSDIEKNMIGFCVEYFHEIPVYEMVDAENVSIISEPKIFQDNDFLSVWHGARSLINLAIGTRQFINPRLTLLGGFQTDFDYLNGVDFAGTSNENNNFVNYYTDVMHIMAGARFTISKHRFIIGTQFSFGSEDQLRQVGDFRPNIVNQENALPVENLVEVPVTYSYNGLALFFGFIFNFAWFRKYFYKKIYQNDCIVHFIFIKSMPLFR